MAEYFELVSGSTATGGFHYRLRSPNDPNVYVDFAIDGNRFSVIPYNGSVGHGLDMNLFARSFSVSCQASGLTIPADPDMMVASGGAFVHRGAVATATDGATVAFNCRASDWHQVTLGGNRTLALTGDVDGQQVMLILKQGGTGSNTVTWFPGVLWAGGAAPTLTTTVNKRDVFVFKRLGSGVYLGFVAGLNL